MSLVLDLPVEVEERLEQLARRNNRPKAQYAVNALTAYLSQQDSEADDDEDFSPAEAARLNKVVADVEAGRMNTYTSKEVRAKLGFPEPTDEERAAVWARVQ